MLMEKANVKNLYNENNNTLLKEIKEWNKWKICHAYASEDSIL